MAIIWLSRALLPAIKEHGVTHELAMLACWMFMSLWCLP
jgi:hypothetical protein